MTEYWSLWVLLAALLALAVLMIVRMFRPKRSVEPPVPRVPRSWIHWIAIIFLAICILGLVMMIFNKEFRDEVSGPLHLFTFIAAGALYVLCDIRFYLGVIASKQLPPVVQSEQKQG